MATIGHVCLQWSLLEGNLLAFLGVIQNIPPEESYILFGGMDMRPRLGTAISLARHHKIPLRFTKRLEDVRKTITNNQIDDRRNQAVHGVHNQSDQLHSTKLVMARWRGDKRAQDVSVADLHKLGMEIVDLNQAVYSIIVDYAAWKFGDHPAINASREFVKPDTSVWFKLKQCFYTCIDLLRGNL